MLKKIGIALLFLLVFGAGIIVSKFFLFKSGPPAPAPKFFEGGKGGAASVKSSSNGTIINVKNGESIQDAVAKAKPGDIIRVFPGLYKETVFIDKENISVQGVIEKGNWPTLDGEKKLNDAFLYSGNFISIEGFKIQNYKGNGIMGQSGNNFVLSNNWIINSGVYGIFPEYGQNGLIEHNILTGIEDAAIYVGMCDNVDVRHNQVYGNVAGIEIENSRHCLVEYNHAYDNAGGILVFITPGLPIKTCQDVIVRNNFVTDNNHKNFGAPGSIVSFIPAGTGIIIMAADDVVIENNIITGNDNTGLAIVDHKTLADLSADPESDPNPDRITILDNIMYNNGSKPAKEVKAAMMLTSMDDKGPDIIANGGGSGSCIRDINRYRTFGLDKYSQCEITSTSQVVSYLLDKPAPPRNKEVENQGKLIYYGVCSGCHAYNVRMIGPPTMTIQALYKNNPQGIADYIKAPVHKRQDYPEMPPQGHISEAARLEVAKFMLSLTK